jgi:hypothetical protein
MTPMATNREHIERLISAHRRRLAELEVKAATLGNETPPDVITEIEDIRLDIAKLEASITALEKISELSSQYEPVAAVDRRDQSSYDQRLHIMIATVQATVAEFSALRKFVADELMNVKWLISRLAIGFTISLLVLMAIVIAFGKLGWL